MKTCSRCKHEKPLDEFNRHSRRGRQEYQAYCRTCQAERYQGSATHKAQIKDRNLRQSAEIARWINEFKLSKGCAHCGYKEYAVALDAHHLDDNKEFSIASAKRRRLSLKRVQVEMQKCKILCAICHRVEHYTSVTQLAA